MESFRPRGVCTREINYEIEDGKIKDIYFIGGCEGNLKGIASLIKGMEVEEVIDRLEGITCGPRKTSCPDQLTKALRQHI